jgi:glycosyltransferase involved in cell wall biosynthesis
MRNKKKLFVYSDSPTATTGFGTLCRHILDGLYNTGLYDITVLGINEIGAPHQLPYKIYPAQYHDDYLGKEKFLRALLELEIDIVFAICEVNAVAIFMPELLEFARQQGKNFKTVIYFPVEGFISEEGINAISYFDYKLTFTEYAKQYLLSKKSDLDIRIIPHGINTKEFYPLPSEEKIALKKQLLQSHSDKFLFTNVNRNTPRKDIPRTLQAFKQFKEHVPNSMLYLHMAQYDSGWYLPDVCKSFDLRIPDDVLVTDDNFSTFKGVDVEMLNIIYNITDCLISTTQGEGWGLTWTEAMATKTPVIMPNNTAMTENIIPERGYLVKSGTNPNLFVFSKDIKAFLPIVDVDDMVETMLHVYQHPDEATQKAETAYQWVTQQLNWTKNIVPKWLMLFNEVAVSAIKSKQQGE